MSILKEEYEIIAPKLDYLTDEVILASAWKKSHNYIRRHNWYADILELDCSTVNIKKRIQNLSISLKEKSYKPKPLRVVLAPKSQKWYFPNGNEKKWYPEPTDKKIENVEKGKQELRPLAHLTIRDQTAATAVMLCLADAIESLQGPTEEHDFLKAQQKNIYSYGNRLQCEWISQLSRSKARFSWGNSKCYRQYFEDYRAFLKRPKNVLNYYATSLTSSKELYMISLDLKNFYENIDLNSLVDELSRLYNDFVEGFHLPFKDEPSFWERVKEIFNWEWNDKDYSEGNEIIKNKKSSLGLPQGLVASGFFANAYLIGFDNLIGDYIKEYIKENEKEIEIKLLDYCRYVDDIRIVIEASKDYNHEEIKEKVSNFVQKLLNKHMDRLGSSDEYKIEINHEKTNIVSYSQLSTENSISSRMNNIQHQISGTPDTETLQQVVGELVGLLQVSDALESENIKKGNALELSRIETPYTDVRDETVKRFSATRLVKTLRAKKSMTVHSEKIPVNEIESNYVTAERILDHEFETVARKLISLWAENPSLSLLLKFGLELFPDVKLLYPVLEALKLKINDSDTTFEEKKTAEYIISDLLKAASINIGYSPEHDYPENVDLASFREELAVFAKGLVNMSSQYPWYVKQQAILFLITNGNYGFSIDEKDEELKNYKLLYDLILYKIDNVKNRDILDVLAISSIAQQLKPDSQKFTTWFINWMNNLNNMDSKKESISFLLTERPDLLWKVVQSNRMKDSKWTNIIPDFVNTYLKTNSKWKFNFDIKEPIPLIKIIRDKNNPFKQENALLLLVKTILEKPGSLENLSKGKGITYLKVKCNNWMKVQDPSYSNNLEITWDDDIKDNDFNLLEHPTWVKEEFKWMYTLGAILRGCLTGENDFTAHTFLYREDTGIYKGIKSTAYTRRLSINNTGKGLVGDFFPITPWLTELLYKLLQWPGINQRDVYIKDWKHVVTIDDLLIIIQKRLNHQSGIYGKLSNMPVYSLPVTRNAENKNAKLRFAVVQPLLPQTKDFNIKDPTNWNTNYRKKHKDHLASICHILNKQIKTTELAKSSWDAHNDDTFNGVDVIVFPELSVHPDDLYILRRLSDNTKAHIFAGLTFFQPDYTTRPINQALWLLRIERGSNRDFLYVYQGKEHMTNSERNMGIQSFRPYQVLIELEGKEEEPIRLAGSICYDATDLKIAADLRDVSDVFIISAMNKDIQTFDNMVAYLHYHMYQPVILANTGEFGGSTVQAPFSKHQKTIAHVHGNQQIAISIFEIDPTIFKRKSKPEPFPEIKTPPAGYEGREQ